MAHLSRVLAAVDFSKPARAAFEYALTLSRKHGAELAVVHAVPPNEAFSRHARERLALTMKLRRRADEAKVAFSERVQQGDPAATILSHARSLGPEVIVMGTHQRGRVERFRKGSVSERVTATATTPVLLIPPRWDASTIRPFRHVAVAVDFSASSDRAIEHAVTLADGPADRITLLHVVPRSAPGVLEDSYRLGIVDHQHQLMRDDQDQLIRDAVRRLQLAVPMPPRTLAATDARVLVGNTAAELSRGADSMGADLLIVGVPTRGVVARTLFGTTATSLLRVTAVPMLAVPDVSITTVDREVSAVQRAA